MIRAWSQYPVGAVALSNTLTIHLNETGIQFEITIAQPELLDSFLKLMIGLQKGMLSPDICEAGRTALSADDYEVLQHMTLRYLGDDVPDQEVSLIHASNLGSHLRKMMGHD
jgi:hypothetical protein